VSWNKKQSRERIKAAWSETDGLVVQDLVRETDLSGLGLKKAYRVDGVHVFASIPNASTLLETTDAEGELCHKRYLRFLNLYQRVTHVALGQTDAQKVDFQNERLHFMLYKPYGDAEKRIANAVVIADALQRLVVQVNDLHDELPDAISRIGIETGKSLAVRNGTRGDREPLFLGDCVNHAAKLSVGTSAGIYLGHAARAVLGKDWAVDEPSKTRLTGKQIADLYEKADISLDVDKLVESYEEEKKESPLGEFKFFRPTPPLSNLDPDALAAAKTARIDSTAFMADIDGFTDYVTERMEDTKKAAKAVRVLHVVRKELRDVLKDFEGRKIRYIGDCLQGVRADGPKSTEEAESVRNAVRCAGALRSSFDLVKEEISDAESLGLAIGLELGPVSITRLGIRSSKDRVLIGRAVIGAEDAQRSCSGTETKIGPLAFKAAEASVRAIFASNRKRADLDYNTVELELELEEQKQKDEKRASLSKAIHEAPSSVPRAYAK